MHLPSQTARPTCDNAASSARPSAPSEWVPTTQAARHRGRTGASPTRSRTRGRAADVAWPSVAPRGERPSVSEGPACQARDKRRGDPCAPIDAAHAGTATRQPTAAAYRKVNVRARLLPKVRLSTPGRAEERSCTAVTRGGPPPVRRRGG